MLINMSVHIVNVLWLLSYSHPCISALVCKGLKGLTCCTGFTGHVWNETVHNCTSCMSGFHGENCASSCPFPYYGIRCGLKCNCSEDECHHQYGCKRRLGDCDPGVVGPYCELTCRYPGFGKDCQMECECEEQNCNPMTGCILDSSSPAAGPLAKTTTAYPLNAANENFNSSSPAAGPLTKTTVPYPLNEVNENFNCYSRVYGPYCELTCPYPGFGEECQMAFGCEKHNCVPIAGCLCVSPEDSKHRRTIIYITIVLGTVAGLQLTAYIWLSFCRPTTPQRSELPI